MSYTKISKSEENDINFFELPQIRNACIKVEGEPAPSLERSTITIKNWLTKNRSPLGYSTGLEAVDNDSAKLIVEELKKNSDKITIALLNQENNEIETLLPFNYQIKLEDSMRVLRACIETHIDSKSKIFNNILFKYLPANAVAYLILSSIMETSDEIKLYLPILIFQGITVSYNLAKVRFGFLDRVDTLEGAVLGQIKFVINKELKNPESTASKIVDRVSSKNNN